MKTNNALLAATAFIPAISALGINCRGSHNCHKSNDIMAKFENAMNMTLSLGGNFFYYEGQHIVCAVDAEMSGGHYCAFYQRGASGWLSQAHDEIVRLIDHGCISCGSSPTDWDTSNVNDGEFTVNSVNVHKPLCEPECTSTDKEYPLYYVCRTSGIDASNGEKNDRVCPQHSDENIENERLIREKDEWWKTWGNACWDEDHWPYDDPPDYDMPSCNYKRELGDAEDGGAADETSSGGIAQAQPSANSTTREDVSEPINATAPLETQGVPPEQASTLGEREEHIVTVDTVEGPLNVSVSGMGSLEEAQAMIQNVGIDLAWLRVNVDSPTAPAGHEKREDHWVA